MNTGLPLPSGALSGVARCNFDQISYGDIEEYSRIGWSNFNGVQL